MSEEREGWYKERDARVEGWDRTGRYYVGDLQGSHRDRLPQEVGRLFLSTVGMVGHGRCDLEVLRRRGTEEGEGLELGSYCLDILGLCTNEHRTDEGFSYTPSNSLFSRLAPSFVTCFRFRSTFSRPPRPSFTKLPVTGRECPTLLYPRECSDDHHFYLSYENFPLKSRT